MLAVSLLAALLPGVANIDRAEAAAPAATIVVYADRVFPEGSVVLSSRADTQVRFENRTGDVLEVAVDGISDSGPIPDGGAFGTGLPLVGTTTWTATDPTGGEVVSGVVTVVAEDVVALYGDGDARLADVMQDLAPAPYRAGEVQDHPTLAAPVSRDRFQVLMEPDATVGQLEAVRREVFGALGGVVAPAGLFTIMDTGAFPNSTHAWVDGAVDAVRGLPGVAAAVHDGPVEELALPDAPRSTSGPSEGAFDDNLDEPIGAGRNFGLEQVRMPAVWNLLETIDRRGGPRHDVLVLDSGFTASPDLTRVREVTLCVPGGYRPITRTPLSTQVCSTPTVADHGTAVSGVIAADHDTDGVTGYDARAEVRVSSLTMSSDDASSRVGSNQSGMPALLDLVVDEATSGTGPNATVGVVNISQTLPFDDVAWVDTWAGATCGAGDDDDDGGTLPCYPWHEDGRRAYVDGWGLIYRTIMATAPTAGRPLVVAGAGNESADLCPGLAADCLRAEGIPIPTDRSSMFGSASRQWRAIDGPNPIVMVGGVGRLEPDAAGACCDRFAGVQREFLSNTGGDVSAAVWALLALPSEAGGFAEGQGTSFATPAVAGVASTLLSFDRTLGVQRMKSLLVDFAIPDTTEDVGPRVDAYAAITSLPGATEALADLSDPSPDGNRRVVLGPDGLPSSVDTTSSTTAGAATEPDGVVDLRDFRRFRDAWLQGCGIEGGDGCPATAALDGAPDHPKRDLNLDGCVATWSDDDPRHAAECTAETDWSRFDLNGDGVVSRTARAVVGRDDSGAPVSSRAAASSLTDLEVLALHWAPPADTAGVTADRLDELLVSGDLTVHLDQFVRPGVTEVELTLATLDGATEVWASTQVPVGATPVLTVPAGREWALTARAEGTDGVLDHTTRPQQPLLPGEDRRLDVCSSIDMVSSPPSLAPGDDPATVTVAVDTCDGDGAGTTVNLTATPLLGAGQDATAAPTLDRTSAVTDAEGLATFTLTPGDQPVDVVLDARATLLLPDGPVDRTARLLVAGIGAYDVATVGADRTGALVGTLGAGTELGSSVAPDGRVAFAVTDGDRDRVAVGDRGSGATGFTVLADPVLPSLDAPPSLGQDGAVASGWSGVDGDLVLREVVMADADAPGTVPEVLASAASAIFGPEPTDRFSRVSRPTVNDVGGHLFRATTQDGVQSLARREGALVVTGTPLDTTGPSLADDGASVAVALTAPADPTANFREVLVAGPDVLPGGAVVVAEGGDCTFVTLDPEPCAPGPDGYRTLGQAAVAATGGALSFLALANDGAGPGVAVSLRTGTAPTAWSTPLPVVGFDALATRPALPDGSRFADFSLEPTGVVHTTRAPAGIEGDVLAVVFVATPAAGSTAYPPTEGVFVVRAEVAVDDVTGAPSLVTSRARKVVQVGERVDGAEVRGIALHEPIAHPDDAVYPADHHVAVTLDTDQGGRVIVARPPDELALAPGMTLTETPLPPFTVEPTGTATLTAASTRIVAAPESPAADARVVLAAAAPPAATGGPVAAFTVSTLEPTAREPFTITNRSRGPDGALVEAVLGEDPRLGLPATRLGPEEVLEVVAAEAGFADIDVGVPLEPSATTSTTGIRLRVLAGANRPPVIVDVTAAEVPTGGDAQLQVVYEDPDRDFATVSWDLDDDGTFGDATGSILRLTAEEAATRVCGGTCTDGVPYVLAVRVQDPDGEVDTATTTLTYRGDQDFSIDLLPSQLQIDPGSAAYAYVDLLPVAGFDQLAALRAEGVPEGWTVTFSPDEVSASNSSRMRVAVPAGETVDFATLEVVASYGDQERRADVTVNTTFGLLPRCTATLSASVVSAVTGETPPDVSVRVAGASTSQGVDGRFTREIELPQGYEVLETSVSAVADGYRRSIAPARITCGERTDVDLVLDPLEIGTINARVVEGRFNPFPSGAPVATDVPIAGATVLVTSTGVGSGTTAADGTVSIPWELPDNVTNPNAAVRAELDGYWDISAFAYFDETNTADVGDLALLPICYGTVGGGRVVTPAGDPVSGATVVVGSEELVTDADGNFFSDAEVPLGRYNRPRTVSFTAYPPEGAEWESTQPDVDTANLSACGEPASGVLLVLEPLVEVERTADVVGTLTDRETGLPLPGLPVVLERQQPSTGRYLVVDSATSGADGSYRFDDVLVGVTLDTDPEPAEASMRVTSGVGRDGAYWGTTTPGTLVVSETEARIDASRVPVLYGRLEVLVVDRETGTPLEGAFVNTSGTIFAELTDAAGQVTYDRYVLGYENAPVEVSVSSSRMVDGERTHWNTSTRVTVAAEETTEVTLRPLAVCPGGSVSGVVFDASTGEPLPGATVRADTQSTTTDATGAFAIDGIRVGAGNVDNEVTVSASKEGFFSASRRITVYCGSTAVVDFGRDSSARGVITGTVTEATDGSPVVGASVYTGYGDATTTAADGTYRFEDVPLRPDDTPRTWEVTVIDGSRRTAAPVTVADEPDAVLDFELATATNTVPTVVSDEVEVEVGGEVALPLSGSDGDGDVLTYAVTEDPSAGDLVGDLPALRYLAPATPGTYRLTYTASDGEAVSDPGTITIRVVPAANQPPVLEAPVEVAVVVDGGGTADVRASDPDDDDVTLRLDDPPSWARLDDAGGGEGILVLTAVPAGADGTELTVVADDGTATVTATTRVVVSGLGPTAVIDVVDAELRDDGVTVPEGSTVTFDATRSTDPLGDGLRASWAVGEGAPQEGDRLTLDLPDDRVVDVVLTVEDADGAIATATVTVAAINAVPTLEVVAGDPAATADLFAPPGSTVMWQLAVRDAGPEDVHELRSAVPDGVEVSLVDRVVTVTTTAPEQGSTTVPLELCDDDGGCTTREVRVLALVEDADDDVPVDPAPDPAAPEGTPEPAPDEQVGSGQVERDEELPAAGSATLRWLLFALAALAVGGRLTRRRVS